MTNLPEKPCAFCGTYFPPDARDSQYCSRSCANRGTAPQRLVTARARQRRQLEQVLGPLSERDLEVARAVKTIEYQRGYHKALRENRADAETA